MKKLLLLSLLLFGAYACSDEESETPAKDEAVATIDGVAFKPEQTTSTNTGSGLEIKLKDGSDEIILRLEDDAAGTYSIVNSLPGGRTQALDAYAECIMSGDVYYATSGSIILTVNSDGTVTGKFTFDASSIDGDEIEIKAGTFASVEVGTLAEFGCLIKSSTEDDGDSQELEYNSDGQLVRYSYEFDDGDVEGYTAYSYVNGVLESAIEVETYNGSTEVDYLNFTITSANNRITKIRSTDQDGYYDESVFTYNSSGKIVQVDSFGKSDGQTYEDCGGLITYSGENVSKEENEASCESDFTVTYTGYDTKENQVQLLTKALGNSKALASFLFFGGGGLSKNNPGTHTETYSSGGLTPESNTISYSYVYNSKNYPTKITMTRQDGKYVQNFTYMNCN